MSPTNHQNKPPKKKQTREQMFKELAEDFSRRIKDPANRPYFNRLQGEMFAMLTKPTKTQRSVVR